MSDDLNLKENRKTLRAGHRAGRRSAVKTTDPKLHESKAILMGYPAYGVVLYWPHSWSPIMLLRFAILSRTRKGRKATYYSARYDRMLWQTPGTKGEAHSKPYFCDKKPHTFGASDLCFSDTEVVSAFEQRLEAHRTRLLHQGNQLVEKLADLGREAQWVTEQQKKLPQFLPLPAVTRMQAL